MSICIIADENIPFARRAFSELGTVTTLPGEAITAAAVETADAVLVRSVTTVDASLLDGSPVRFVGSATTGTDHVDTEYLNEAGIAFVHAPGANAASVADYVVAALVELSVRAGEPLRGKTVGIVGCGHIGSRLARRLPALGLDVLRNDPPRAAAAQGQAHGFVSLSQVLEAADIVTLHVPLTRTGPHPTYHLIDDSALEALSPDTWLVNTSRGAVVDPDGLRAHLEHGPLGAAVIDVWADEPAPDPKLVRRVDLATPHIAGYAFDGKVRGTAMVYQALCEELSVEPTWETEPLLAPQTPDALQCTPPDPTLPETEWLHHVTRQMYDIAADDERLRAGMRGASDERATHFRRLRREYPRRREFAPHQIPAHAVPAGYRPAAEGGLEIQLSAMESRLADT